jgi:hypothetical protein
MPLFVIASARKLADRIFKLILNVLSEKPQNKSKLSTTDLLVPATMKNAAKCDK